MQSTLTSTTLILLLPLALSAQQPSSIPALSEVLQQPLVDVAEGTGLQPDGENRLLGHGGDYLAKFSSLGMSFVPALGNAAEDVRFLNLRPRSVRRGDQPIAGPLSAVPNQVEFRAEYRHSAAMTERFDVGTKGVELSWQFLQRPAGSGDLIVSYKVETNLPLAANQSDGLSFVENGLGGVAIGSVTGIDAAGQRIAGQLSFADGFLEMSLPAEFVDSASYPIVLDPLVGSVIQVSTTGNNDDEPDVAYDASTQNYLVAWRRTFASTLVVVRARLISATGVPAGSVVILSSSGICGRPRVANCNYLDRFGVVFEELIGSFQGVQFRAVDAMSGAITHSAVLASSTGINLYRHPDVGGVVNSINTTAFVTVFEDNIQNAIRVRRVYFDASDNLVAPASVSVFTDTSGPLSSNTYTTPAISRQAGSDLNFMVVARRYSGLGPSRIISGKLVKLNTLVASGSVNIELASSDDVTMPDVDGANGGWVVAWQRHPSGGGSTQIERRTAHNSGSGWSLGAVHTFGGGLLSVSAPTVGWSQARTWLGYRNFNGIGSQTSLRVRAIDTASATTCSTEINEVISSADSRIVVATDASGGVNGGSGSLAVFAYGTTVYAQRLISYGNSGTFASLGGQCGSGGAQYFSHAPGIGSSIVCGVVGLSPSAVLSVFNMTTDQSAVTCGLCEWAPFGVTQVHVTTTSTAATGFAIPCLPSLVGSQFVTQWTTFDPQQTGCSLAPEFAMTDRSLMTLGN